MEEFKDQLRRDGKLDARYIADPMQMTNFQSPDDLLKRLTNRIDCAHWNLPTRDNLRDLLDNEFS